VEARKEDRKSKVEGGSEQRSLRVFSFELPASSFYSFASTFHLPPSSLVKLLSLAIFSLFLFASPAHALTDTYQQTFDSMQDGATINGADSWTVVTGKEEDAMVESGDTVSGSGKALKLAGALAPADVNRPATYGGLSPTWIEYVTKAGHGVDERDVPESGIAAILFGPNGKLMASDGTQWIDTGKVYSYDAWYRVLLKVDFSTHMYDIYCEPANSPKTPFLPEKQNLHFIDPEINVLSKIGFMGAYNAQYQADSLVDEMVVHRVDKLAFISSPQTFVKGYASGPITVQLQSSNSEPQTSWKDLSLELKSSTQTGEFSLDKDNWAPITALTLSEGSQQVTFYYKDFTEGRPTISVNEFPDRGWTDALQEQKVVNEGEYFSVTATTPQVAGVPFTVQIAAKDGQGGTDTSYTGAVDIFLQYVSPAAGTKAILPDNSSGFVLGVKDVNMTYADAGIVKIAVRDQADTQKIGYSGDITFTPHSFEVSAEGVQTVGKNFTLTVKALEAEGQLTPNYQGPATLETVPVNPGSAPGGVLNPSELTAGAFQNGAVSLNTAYNRWGTINIKAMDSANPAIKGVSGNIKFVPKSITVSVKKPSGTRSFFYVSENMEITASVLGQDDLPIENFQGTLSLTPTPAFEIPSQVTFSAQDKGQKKFVVPAGSAGNYTLKAENVENGLSVESDRIEVVDATIYVSSTSSPVGSAQVEIQLLDSKGKRIRDENEMTVTILFEEENENGSVFFSELGKPILFKKGIAKVVIGDSEAETVNISARSKYGLKVVNGKVVFGRAGAAGVGTLMLRETKD
jgi:hypothetical protein